MPKLTDVGSGTFAPLKKLMILQMSHNPSLSYIHYDAFKDQSAKSHLSLRQVRDNLSWWTNDFTILAFNFSYTWVTTI